MTTPFAHTQVSHVTRTRRRRSQSVTLPNSREEEEDAPEQSIRRKQFLSQLQNERQKHQNKHDGQHREQRENSENHQQDKDDHYHTAVTRVPGVHNTQLTNKSTASMAAFSVSLKKQISSTSGQTSAAETGQSHRPVVDRVAKTDSTMSTKKHTSSTRPISDSLKREITSISSSSSNSEENANQHEHPSQVHRVPPPDSKMLLNRNISTKTCQSSNVTVITNVKNPKHDSFTTSKGTHFDSSNGSSYPLLSSSTNLMSKSEIFDQDFHLNDSADHARRNDTKRHGKVNISGREKNYATYDPKLAARSSASFMTAVIAVIIGIMAFALGLASLVLVLLLRSTVNTALATNSTTGDSSSSSVTTDVAGWTLACSSYTSLNDPTRNVYAPGYALGCDNTAPFANLTTPVWIRFVGTGGTTLPLTTPGMDICGSQGTGWYDGKMPSSGQILNGTACFTWYTSVCRFSLSISVANCGSFYTYRLPPAPACMMRYCTI